MAKTYYGFRFNAEQYAAFKQIATSNGLTVTGAFERFMNSCIDVGKPVFPDRENLDVANEARVLVDWLEKGKRFFRDEKGEEVNIQGRLLCLLPKASDTALKGRIEVVLKKSVSNQE
jgi:hypothetical protein